MTLAGIIFAQIGQVMNCRTETTSVSKIGLFSNRRILIGIVFEVVLLVVLTTFPPLQGAFHTAPLAWAGLCVPLLRPAAGHRYRRDSQGMVAPP